MMTAMVAIRVVSAGLRAGVDGPPAESGLVEDAGPAASANHRSSIM